MSKSCNIAFSVNCNHIIVFVYSSCHSCYIMVRLMIYSKSINRPRYYRPIGLNITVSQHRTFLNLQILFLQKIYKKGIIITKYQKMLATGMRCSVLVWLVYFTLLLFMNIKVFIEPG